MNQPRPIHHLNTAMALYPRLPRWVDTFRADRGKSLPKWPDWCFLPMAGWYTVVSDGNNMDVLTPQLGFPFIAVGHLALFSRHLQASP